jgi:predicted nucleotide-binding protein (sugar kinase/HSP70/actin superfamily)
MLRKDFESWRVKKAFDRILTRGEEPEFKKILHLAAPYFGTKTNSILILNISKIIDFASRGADGIINAVCFNCMLGTVSSAISEKIRRDFNNIPLSTFVYAGSLSSTLRAKIEAFVHQVKFRHALLKQNG